MPLLKPFARILASADMLADPDTAPEFIVHTDVPIAYAIELATDSTKFSASFSSETTSATPKWFSTALGNTNNSWLIPPEVRQTQRAGTYATDVWKPTGKTLALYANMIQNARGDRLYYRLVVTGLNLYPAAIPQIKGRKLPALRFTYICTSRGVRNRTQPTTNPIGGLPALSVTGNRLTISGTDAPVVLRGVNVSSLQYSRYDSASAVLGASQPSAAPTQSTPTGAQGNSWSAAAGIDARLFDWLQGKGINIVRLTINQEWTLEDDDYRATLDQIIQWANQRGMYVLLALHCVYIVKDPKIPDKFNPYHPPIPDQRTGLFWSLMARRYLTFPGVLFDLLNEPRSPDLNITDDAPYWDAPAENPIPTTKDDKFFFEEWQAWARYLHRIIRGGSASQFDASTQSSQGTKGLRPDAVIFVAGFGGGDWAASLDDEGSQPKPSWPLTDKATSNGSPLTNIVYKVHWYGRPKVNGRTDWLKLIRATEKKPWQFPVFIGEWGAETTQAVTGKAANYPNAGTEYANYMGKRGSPNSDATMVPWARKLVAFLGDRAGWLTDDIWKGLCGWTAWSMGNVPHLVQRDSAYLATGPNQTFQPTDYGDIMLAAAHVTLEWVDLKTTPASGAPPPQLKLTFPAAANKELRVKIKDNAATPDPICGYEVQFKIAQSASVIPISLAAPPKARARDSTQSTIITTTSVGSCTVEVSLVHPTMPTRTLDTLKVDVIVAAKASR